MPPLKLDTIAAGVAPVPGRPGLAFFAGALVAMSPTGSLAQSAAHPSNPGERKDTMYQQIKRGADVAIFPPLAAVTVPTTKILAIGNVTAKGTPDAIGAVLPFEVRATVRLHLAGKIDQWFFQNQSYGVVFIMNCATVAGSLERLRVAGDGAVRRPAPARHEAAGQIVAQEIRLVRRCHSRARSAAARGQGCGRRHGQRIETDRGRRQPHRQGRAEGAHHAVVME